MLVYSLAKKEFNNNIKQNVKHNIEHNINQNIYTGMEHGMYGGNLSYTSMRLSMKTAQMKMY